MKSDQPQAQKRRKTGDGQNSIGSDLDREAAMRTIHNTLASDLKRIADLETDLAEERANVSRKNEEFDILIKQRERTELQLQDLQDRHLECLEEKSALQRKTKEEEAGRKRIQGNMAKMWEAVANYKQDTDALKGSLRLSKMENEELKQEVAKLKEAAKASREREQLLADSEKWR